MYKLKSSALIVFLLICLTISSAARFKPGFHKSPSMENHHESGEVQNVEIEESCEGVNNEECLMRRTLAAHLDYIYTQKQKP